MSEERILRGNRARQIIEDPLFVEAFEGMQKGAIERLAACDVNDTAKLQTLTLSLQAVRSTRHIFQVWMADGEDAARRMQQKELEPSILERFTNRFRR